MAKGDICQWPGCGSLDRVWRCKTYNNKLLCHRHESIFRYHDTTKHEICGCCKNKKPVKGRHLIGGVISAVCGYCQRTYFQQKKICVRCGKNRIVQFYEDKEMKRPVCRSRKCKTEKSRENKPLGKKISDLKKQEILQIEISIKIFIKPG